MRLPASVPIDAGGTSSVSTVHSGQYFGSDFLNAAISDSITPIPGMLIAITEPPLILDATYLAAMSAVVVPTPSPEPTTRFHGGPPFASAKATSGIFRATAS